MFSPYVKRRKKKNLASFVMGIIASLAIFVTILVTGRMEWRAPWPQAVKHCFHLTVVQVVSTEPPWLQRDSVQSPIRGLISRL